MTEMKVTTEDLEYCKVKVNYTASSEVVKKKIKEAISQLRGLQVPGFRPGKATDLAIKVRFKDRIKQWVEREMLNHANDDVLFETKMKPLSRPQIESHILDGNSFSAEMVYMKKPEFQLQQYKGIEVPEPHIEKTVDDLAEHIFEQIRNQNSDSRPYNDDEFVQNGDTVTLDYELSNGTKEEGQLYKVGEKLYPEFDENLFGMVPGDNREFDLEIEGKIVTVKVNLHMGMKSVPAALDDELAKRCGVKSFVELNETVQNIAKSQYRSVRDEMIGNQIKLRLVSDHDFEAPTWLVTMEAQHVAMQEGLKWAELAEDAKENYLNRAKDNVKFTLILDSIRDAEVETELSDNEAINMIKQTLRQKGLQDPESWIQKAQKDGSLYGLVAKAKNDYTMQWLIDNVKVVGNE